MKDKTTMLKCFNHSHFIRALSAPELFEFNNRDEINDSIIYNEIYMESRVSLDDLNLDKSPYMLYGKFITKEEKKGCTLDLMTYFPDSATSIFLRGEYESSIVYDEDIITITSDFNAFKTIQGANRDRISMHDPLISYERKENNVLSYVGGSIKDVYKLSGSKVVHTSSISDEVETFDLYLEELPRFVRKINEVYPKGLLVRKLNIYSNEELKFLKEQKEKEIGKLLHIDDKKEKVERKDLKAQREKREIKKVKKQVKKNKESNRSKRG